MSTTLLHSGLMLSVTFRSPLLFDKRKPHAKALYRRARDFTLYGYKYTSLQQTLELEYGDMNRPTINSILAFLKATDGLQFQITLDDGTVWLGHHLEEPFISVHAGQKNSKFSFKFEGTPVT